MVYPSKPARPAHIPKDDAAGQSPTFRLWAQFVPAPGLIEIYCDRCHYTVIGIYRNVPLERPLVDVLRDHKCRK